MATKAIHGSLFSDDPRYAEMLVLEIAMSNSGVDLERDYTEDMNHLRDSGAVHKGSLRGLLGLPELTGQGPERQGYTFFTYRACEIGFRGNLLGQTAHACVIGIGRVQAGETVVISGAAGAIGSLAGQIAKIRGGRVIGIAGGAAKCAALRELGFDGTADYRATDFVDQLKAACPKGIEVYIDNVGGEVTLAVLPLLKYGARMPVCGYIAYYGVGMEGPGPDHLPGVFRTIMSKGLEVRGISGSAVGGGQALEDIAGWIAEGRLKCPETVVEGLDAAPAAFAGVFSGNANIGKLLVKVAVAG